MQTAESYKCKVLVTYDDLIVIIGIRISKITIWRWERLGLFPKRVKLAGAKVAWKRDEIEQWLNHQISCRSQYLPLGDAR